MEQFEQPSKNLYPIGQGHLGSTYRALRKSDGKNANLKVSDEITSPQVPRGGDEEFSLFSQLTHPNILRYENHFWVRNQLYVVTEYCDNGNPRKNLSIGLSEDQIVYYFVQIAEAISCIHQNELIHRNLKPTNIFLDQFGHMKMEILAFLRSSIKPSKRRELN
jgi:serine/threonine protein kinase